LAIRRGVEIGRRKEETNLKSETGRFKSVSIMVKVRKKNKEGGDRGSRLGNLPGEIARGGRDIDMEGRILSDGIILLSTEKRGSLWGRAG